MCVMKVVLTAQDFQFWYNWNNKQSSQVASLLLSLAPLGVESEILYFNFELRLVVVSIIFRFSYALFTTFSLHAVVSNRKK